MNLPPGLAGLGVGLGIFFGLGTAIYKTRRPGPFNLDPDNRPGAFEPFLLKYLRLAEFVIGLATGSIVSAGGIICIARPRRAPAGVLCFALTSARSLCGVCDRFHGLAYLSLRGTSARYSAQALCIFSQHDVGLCWLGLFLPWVHLACV